MLVVLSLFAAVQQQPGPSGAPSPPIAKVTIQPAELAVQVGDTVRLGVTATDSAGRPIKDLVVRWFQSGGHFEGKVDSSGLVTGGSTGTLTISALVSSRAGGSPATGFARVTVLPGPAARLEFDRMVSRMYAGQSLAIEAIPYAANNDRRYDQVLWASDAPAVVSVSPTGRMSAGRPGRATITARAGRVQRSFAVEVVPNPVTSLQIEPASADARTGDAIRFNFRARDKQGRVVPDIQPEWALSPGNAQIEPDGWLFFGGASR